MPDNSRPWRSGKFACVECGVALHAWVDRMQPVKFAIGDMTKERCPRCRQATFFELVEIVEVAAPTKQELPPGVCN
jgi:hypothetical protein